MKRWVVRSGGFAALALCLGVPPVAAQEIARGIEARELLARIEGGSPPTILDVRRPEEFAEGHISGAINIPFTELEARVSELGIEKS
ncbi:MAG: rhodanese-like domain-containing protein, partial [Gemmatimonadota bacterium]|nr:rhodanese-like domain-containing protein [Gemmatimonadota bacterium]